MCPPGRKPRIYRLIDYCANHYTTECNKNISYIKQVVNIYIEKISIVSVLSMLQHPNL